MQLLLLLISLAVTAARTNVFLTPNEKWLLFPHRQFRTLSTYTSTCNLDPIEGVTENVQLAPVAQISFNNSHIGIDAIASEGNVLHYSKISPNGICSVYEVQRERISLLYEHAVGKQFTQIIIKDSLTVILWNCQEVLRLTFSLFTRTAQEQRIPFKNENARKCSLISKFWLGCWDQQEIALVELRQNLTVWSVPYEGDALSVVIGLGKEEDKTLFMCTYLLCTISHVTPTWQLETTATYPFVQPVLGAIFDQPSSLMVTLHAESANFFIWSAAEQQIYNQESVSFPPEVTCVHPSRLNLVEGQLLVECYDFMGQELDLVLLRDLQINWYFPFRADHNDSCLLEGDNDYIYFVCEKAVYTHRNNFYYLEVISSSEDRLIRVSCQEQTKLETEETEVISADLGQIYIDGQIQAEQTMSYDGTLAVKLKYAFKASDIEYYEVTSSCPELLPTVHYQPWDFLTYFSLYSREPCVQVLSSGSRLFYRLVQINKNTYYLQQCIAIKQSYGCELAAVYQNKTSLRMVLIEGERMSLYLRPEGLILERQDNRVNVIFGGHVSQYKLMGNSLWVNAHGILYFNSLPNLLLGGSWLQGEPGRYFLQSDYLIHLSPDGVLREYRNNHLQAESILAVGESDSETLPFVGRQGYLLIIVNSTHIRKAYGNGSLTLFELAYNIEGRRVSRVSMVDQFLVIEFEVGLLQIYDVQEQAVSSLLASFQEQLLGEVILLDKDMLLVPVQGQTYMLRLQTDPVLLLGPLDVDYSQHHRTCQVSISPKTNNGSCPAFRMHQTSQRFQLVIGFQIQQIDLDRRIQVLAQPRSCSSCDLPIDEDYFLGPIFTYELNDDYLGAFRLKSHLSLHDCSAHSQWVSKATFLKSSEKQQSLGLLKLDNELRLVNSNMDLIQSLTTQANCTHFVKTGNTYLVLCQTQFLGLGEDGSYWFYSHGLSLNSSLALKFQAQPESDFLQSFLIYVLDPLKTMHVYRLAAGERVLTVLRCVQMKPQVVSVSTAKEWVVTLQGKEICIAAANQLKFECYSLNIIIPSDLALTYEYSAVSIYYSCPSELKTLLFSKGVQNLHIDLSIIMLADSPIFQISNTYAGFSGFQLGSVVQINCSTRNYSNFLLLYEEEGNNNPLLAYYPFNNNYFKYGLVGQIKSAEFLLNYFASATFLAIFAFPNRLYIITEKEGVTKGERNCVAAEIVDVLSIQLNYSQPPKLSFLILRARNIHIDQIQSHYIKIVFEPEDDVLFPILIGFAAVILSFIILIVVTNRCKDMPSDIEVILVDEHICADKQQDQFSSHSNDKSSLLHSKSEPSSPRSRLDEEQQDN